MILWGPPGCGKTTIATAIAGHVRAHFEAYSAVLGSVSYVKEAAQKARLRLEKEGTRTVMFVDEIHRFNKAQQDAFLPFVESGVITLVGATTENPSFEVIGPLLSRCKTLVLKPLDEDCIRRIIIRAVADEKNGLGGTGIKLDDDALEFLAQGSRGDARRALSALEAASDIAFARGEGRIALADAEEALQSKMLVYDKGGEEHYNVISAFIKSMRGSDPDAAVYYMVRMIEAGEDPRFILRRMIIFASEDVGNADPTAMLVATSALAAFDAVGLPEGKIPMAQAATYLATAPKSNASYMALNKAIAETKESGSLDVPLKIRNAPTKLMKSLDYHKGYNYPHDAEGSFSPEHYLPDKIKGKIFYQPTENGYEKKIKERLSAWRALRDKKAK